MNQIFQESNLQFDFSKASKAIPFDKPDTHKVQDFKKVDFFVEQKDDLLLIEVKGGKPENVKKDDLIWKAKDSFLYLLLMDEFNEEKPIKYFVLMDLDSNFDSALLTRKSDHLRQRLGITDPPWSKRPYFVSALVLNFHTWEKFLPQFPINRLT